MWAHFNWFSSLTWIAAITGDSLTFTISSIIIYSPMRIEMLWWWIFIKTKTLKWPLGFDPFKFIKMSFMGMSTSSSLIFLTNMMMIIIICTAIYTKISLCKWTSHLSPVLPFSETIYSQFHIFQCFNHMRLFNKRSIEIKKIITFDVNIRYVRRYGKYEGEILSLPPYWHIIFMQLHLCLLIICSLFFFLCHFICAEHI